MLHHSYWRYLQPRKGLLFLLALAFMASGFFIYQGFSKISGITLDHQNQKSVDEEIKQFYDSLITSNELKSNYQLSENRYQITHSISDELQNYIFRYLKRYNSDYASVVVMDNKTGAVTAIVGQDRNKKDPINFLPFSTTHPAASIFKIVAAAELLENTNVGLETTFRFPGRATTLYKYQVEQEESLRWRQVHSLEKAFAISNNAVFGRAAVSKIDSNSLLKTAEKMGFNHSINPRMPMSASRLDAPRDNYNLAEIASGFNRNTFISPIHATYLAQIIANNGYGMKPNIVQLVKDENDKILYQFKSSGQNIIEPSTAEDLQKAMELVVRRGTARGYFSYLQRKNPSLKVGGKTGSLTGGLPYGRRDWFVMFAQDPEIDIDLSIGVMIINKKHWYVKSTQVARDVLRYIINDKKKVEIKIAKKDQ
jgi:penicillin-binding protein A